MGVESGWFSNSELSQFERLYHKLPGLFPKEKPRLVHGDLWSGNYLIDQDSNPVLIDPAAYFGHREVDIAMTRLFGGFDEAFYKSYNEVFPLETGWKDRIDLYNLYPLLIHVNLFGSGYVQQVKRIIAKWV
jgi:fructosamine-3-kinase